ncbi:kinesin-like protein KIN-14E, partial [Tanacetum coccineum]
MEDTYNSLTYASRVCSIANDPSKNVSSKEVTKLKKLLAYWKEKARKRGDDKELMEYKGRVRQTRGRVFLKRGRMMQGHWIAMST